MSGNQDAVAGARQDELAPWDDAELSRARLRRVRDGLQRQGLAACVLFDPVNVRYATGTRNMSVWCLHNAARYCFVPAEGPVVMFEPHGCRHLSSGAATVAEVRPAQSWFFFASGPRSEEQARKWAHEITDLLHAAAAGATRLAVDRIDPAGVAALAALGIDVVDGQAVLELARHIKLEAEIVCMRESIAAAQEGMRRMRAALVPGMTEQALWSILHQANVELGGEWIETRLLTSGPRTNPWMQECAERVIAAGDLVSFDTDLIGPHGYCADISRCYLAGDGAATVEQKTLYRLAVEQIEHNLALLRPGVSFRELADQAWPIPDLYYDNRYSCVLHGIGLCDEYPNIPHARDFDESGYDGVLQANMTVCVESYIGARGGRQGVKLEQQVLILPAGVEILSTFPLEERLLD